MSLMVYKINARFATKTDWSESESRKIGLSMNFGLVSVQNLTSCLEKQD